MIDCKVQDQLNIQLEKEVNELSQFKKTYMEKIELYQKSENYMGSYLEENDSQNKKILYFLKKRTEKRIKEYGIQVEKIDNCVEALNSLIENHEGLDEKELDKKLKKYNKKFEEIKENLIINIWIFEENKILKYMDSHDKGEKVEEKPAEKEIGNDTLIISQMAKKVVLPYTKEDVQRILNRKDTNYKTADEVIEKEFVKPLSNYRFQMFSRFRETIKLAVERDGYRLMDAISLAFEMMGKKYLYPAIISACRNIDELDVYLDCLDKNELDDFKIFNVKYDLCPTVSKKKK